MKSQAENSTPPGRTERARERERERIVDLASLAICFYHARGVYTVSWRE